MQAGQICVAVALLLALPSVPITPTGAASTTRGGSVVAEEVAHAHRVGPRRRWASGRGPRMAGAVERLQRGRSGQRERRAAGRRARVRVRRCGISRCAVGRRLGTGRRTLAGRHSVRWRRTARLVVWGLRVASERSCDGGRSKNSARVSSLRLGADGATLDTVVDTDGEGRRSTKEAAPRKRNGGRRSEMTRNRPGARTSSFPAGPHLIDRSRRCPTTP